MKIGILSSTQKTAEETEKRTRILSEMLAGETQLDIIQSDSPLKQLQSIEDHRIATPYMVEAAKREEGLYGAYIIGCLGDAGFAELKRATLTPVIPPSRSAYLMAATMFGRVSVIANNEEGAELRRNMFKKMGIDSSLSHVIVTDMAPHDYIHVPDQALKRITGLLAEKEDGHARAIIPTCASLAFLLEDRGIQSLAGMKVVNPLCVAIRIAEILCWQ